MRRRNTEISTFSMSALDLFACSLGVFVLLTIVFLPFFPNTGHHPAVSEATMTRLSIAETTVGELSELSKNQDTQITLSQAQIQSLQSELQASEQNSQRLADLLSQSQNLQEKQQLAGFAPKNKGSLIEFPPVDVVIALDSTGSMRAQIEGLKTEITQFAELMLQLSPSVGIGVVEYKDRCDSQTIRTFDLVEMNSLSIPRIQAFANQVEPGGDFCNRDGPEALKSALEAATQMNWRESTDVQLIVIITDNSAYKEEHFEALNIATAFAARGNGYSVGVAQVGANREAKQFLTQLVKAGGGERVSAGGSFSTTILLSLAGL